MATALHVRTSDRGMINSGARPHEGWGDRWAAAPTSPSAAGTPLAGQPMTAKDGTNTKSCRDGSCEVLVSAGKNFRVGTSIGVATVVVQEVGPQGIAVHFAFDSGFSSVTPVSSGPVQGEFMKMNDVAVVAVAVDGSSGVLRFTRG